VFFIFQVTRLLLAMAVSSHSLFLVFLSSEMLMMPLGERMGPTLMAILCGLKLLTAVKMAGVADLAMATDHHCDTRTGEAATETGMETGMEIEVVEEEVIEAMTMTEVVVMVEVETMVMTEIEDALLKENTIK